jgi:acyl-coenzyme A thioesterase PaaI-like protein
MRPATLRRLMNLWPPFLVNGISVTHIARDWGALSVRLRRRPWNRNYVGTHFGGNLFAMTDPMWMIMAIHRLGPDYVVWDKAGKIEFVKPAREDVFADFLLEPKVVDEMKEATRNGEKLLRWFECDVRTASGELIAQVSKQLYVRRKRERS